MYTRSDESDCQNNFPIARVLHNGTISQVIGNAGDMFAVFPRRIPPGKDSRRRTELYIGLMRPQNSFYLDLEMDHQKASGVFRFGPAHPSN